MLQVDFGTEIGVRKSSVQITGLYRPEEPVGRPALAWSIFKSKKIGPLLSECLVTGFLDVNGDVVLCVPNKSVPLGAKLM